MERFNVVLSSEVVGSVDVIEEGLYLRFRCRCNIPKEHIYRLFVRCKTLYYDLGILILEGEYFSADKRVPKKKLSSNDFQFVIKPNSDDRCVRIEQIDPELPFQALNHLHKAHLDIQNGRYCAVY